MSLLVYRIQKIHDRLSKLCQLADATASPSPELLPSALVELGIVSEALQLAVNELTQKHEQLVSVRQNIELERQHYHELFDLISDGYLVTDQSLLIQTANCAAADLFNIQQPLLSGRSLLNLVHEDDRLSIRIMLSRLSHQSYIDFSTCFQRQSSELFKADCRIKTAFDHENALNYHWLLSTKSLPKEVFASEDTSHLYNDRRIYSYSKGDSIPLNVDQVWFVCRGVAKLTAISHTGEEMVIGLAQDSMIFGIPLTSLKTHATAICRTQLIPIPLQEVAHSPHLANVFLHAINQRLQQTERFLSIYGQLRVEDRFCCLLTLLKQELGQPVKEGIRLRVRLTHQDLASLCGTTRVTVTRLLGKLQQSGKVFLDSHNHLIIKE